MSKDEKQFDPTQTGSQTVISYDLCLAPNVMEESKLENRKIYLQKVGNLVKYSVLVLNKRGQNIIDSGKKSLAAGNIPIDLLEIRDPFKLEMIGLSFILSLQDAMIENGHIPAVSRIKPVLKRIGGYPVCLETSEIKKIKIEKQKIYIRKKEESLEYGVLDPFNNNPIIDHITYDELKRPIPEPFSLDRIGSLLPDLTKIIYGRGHIPIEAHEIKITTGSIIGRGSSAILYRGRWKNKDVAVKEIKIDEDEDHYTPQAITELKQEITVLAKVKSDNIVEFQGVYKSPKYCLVMEYMPRGNLYQLLHSSQAISWQIRYRIALDIAHGLEKLHESNIIYGDLKSLNILLSDHLRAKLCDFGISKIKNQTVTTVISSEEQREIKGSIRWMASELFDSSPSTKRSDMYSFGMVLWEMTTRKLPFANISDSLLIYHIENGGKENIPEEIKKEHPQLPQLVEFIDQCWQNQYERPTVQRACEVLTELNESKPVEPKLPGSDPALPLPPKKETPSKGKKEIQNIQARLIKACEEGDLKEVDRALALGANLIDSDEKGKNPLCAAVWGMDIVIVNKFVDMLGDQVLDWKEIERRNEKHYNKQVWKISGYSPIPKDHAGFLKLLSENGSGMTWDVTLTVSEIAELCLELEEGLNRKKAIIKSIVESRIKKEPGKPEKPKPKPSTSTEGDELKVPGDGSCLFWSVALGVLIPVLDQKEEYRLAFNSLFVSDEKDSQLFIEHGEALKRKIKDFVRTKDTTLISDSKTVFYQLINWYFRQKVASYIDSHSGEFSDYITVSLTQYVSNLRDVSAWAGEIEVYAIYKMLNEQYRIEVENSDVRPLGDLDKPKIQIIYTNAQGKKEGPKNHYNLRMHNVKYEFPVFKKPVKVEPEPKTPIKTLPKIPDKTPPQMKQTKKIELPDDPSCLFLAVAINLLAYVFNDEEKYHIMFDCLFALDEKDAELFYRYGAGLKARIQAFLAGDEKTIKKKDKDDLYDLINHHFRLKIANYIDLHFSEFSAFIEGSFTQYIEKLRQGTFVGGYIEVIAMFRLLSENYRFFIDGIIDLGASENSVVYLIHNGGTTGRDHYDLRVPEAIIEKPNPVVKLEILNVILDKLITRYLNPVPGGKVVYTAEPSNTLIEEKSSVLIPYAVGDGRIPHFSGGTSEFSRVAFSSVIAPTVLTPEEKELAETKLGGELKRIGFFNIPLGHKVAFSGSSQKIKSENGAVSTRCGGSTYSKKAGHVGISPVGNTSPFQRCVFQPSPPDEKSVYTPSPEEQKLSTVRTLLECGFFNIPEGHHIVSMRIPDQKPASLTEVKETIPATVGGNNPGLHIGIMARGSTDPFPRIIRK